MIGIHVSVIRMTIRVRKIVREYSQFYTDNLRILLWLIILQGLPMWIVCQILSISILNEVN